MKLLQNIAFAKHSFTNIQLIYFLHIILFLCDGWVTLRNHSVHWSVCPSVGPNMIFNTNFQRKIQHKMDTIANAVTQLGVPALVHETSSFIMPIVYMSLKIAKVFPIYFTVWRFLYEKVWFTIRIWYANGMIVSHFYEVNMSNSI